MVAIVLKNCDRSLARPLRYLFNISYSCGEFPSCWNFANVQPIPKEGEATNPANYRPISICSTLSKVMESIVNDHLMGYIENNKLLSDRQYGFRKKRSTGDLMALLADKMNSSVHSFGEGKVVALDIAKAFDRVWHSALVHKIKALGVGNVFTRWISSFLSNRSIRVVVDGFASDNYCINAIVPQGSVLSPTLFLVFINDLLSLTKNPIYSFADDSSICHSFVFRKRPSSSELVSSRTAMNDTLNRDLCLITEWGKVNRVNFNAKKTQCCFLTHRRMGSSFFPLKFGGVDVAESDALDILGMSMQCDLRWSEHIFGIAKEASKCLGFLKRCKKYFTSTDLRNIYITYIRPKMEFNMHVWAGAPKTSLELLDRVQRRAFRIIGDNAITDSINTLEHRRNVGCVTLFYRYFNGVCSEEIRDIFPSVRVFRRNTRLTTSSHPFCVATVFQRTSHFRENSFFGRTARLWNSLPVEVFPHDYNIEAFKRNIHRHFSLFPPSH